MKFLNQIKNYLSLLVIVSVIAAVLFAGRIESFQDDDISSLIASMSFEEKVGQLMFLFPSEGHMPYDAIAKYHVGGVYIGERQVVPKPPARSERMPIDAQRYAPDRLVPALRGMTDRLRGMSPKYKMGEARATVPIFIAGDFEGGELPALSWGVTDVPSPMAVAQTRNPAMYLDAGRLVGADMSDLGFNMDFAPVAEILPRGSDTFMGSRSPGEDPNLVAEVTVAFAKGLAEYGVVATAKHLPGHGLTMGNPHHEMTWRTEPTREDLIPFVMLRKAGVPAVMSAHIVIGKPRPGYQSLPFSIEPTQLNRVLKTNDLDNMMVVSDELFFMKAVRIGLGGKGDSMTPDMIKRAATMAFEAGNDVILFRDEKRLPVAAAALYEYFRANPEHLDRSLRKILKIKLALGTKNPPSIADAIRSMNGRANDGLKMAQASIVKIKGDYSLKTASGRLVVVSPSNGLYHENLASAIKRMKPETPVGAYYFPFKAKEWDRSRAKSELDPKNRAGMYSIIVEEMKVDGKAALVLAFARPDEAYFAAEAAKRLRSEGYSGKIVLVSLGPPNMISKSSLDALDVAYISASSRSRVSLEAVVNLLFGKIPLSENARLTVTF